MDGRRGHRLDRGPARRAQLRARPRSLSAPAVSILLPVRDEAAYLAAALDSLSAQTFADFEALVVDDGSRDESAEIAAAHARRDPRFRLLRQPARGLVAALELARAQARAPLLARMDGDDVALPLRLELQVEALEAEPLVACGGRIEYFPRDVVRDGARRYERWLNGLVDADAAARDVFVECPLPHPALLARADAVAAAGGYRDRGWPEDYDLVLRLWAAGGGFRNVDALVHRWREHPDRHSRRDTTFAQRSFVRCKVHHLNATLLRGRAALVFGAGPVGKSFARELRAQDAEVAAFVEVDPRKLGKRVYGIPVVGIEQAASVAGALGLGAVAGEAGRARVREDAAAAGIELVAVA